MDEKGNALKDLWWVGAVLIVLWLVWVIGGGPARYETNKGVLLKQPAHLSTGQTYGELPAVDIDIKIPQTLNVNLFGKRAALGTQSNLSSSDPDKEHLTIVGLSDTPVNITGWKLVGKKRVEAVIPQGVRVFRAGQVNEPADIYLAKGQRAVIISGKSPVGISFRLNSCSKYLEQFQNFYPKITSSCPALFDQETANSLDATCGEYIEEMPACTTPITALPRELSDACRESILTKASYNACVDGHEKDSGFLSGEWRVYLNEPKELWGARDTIKFYDKNDKLIGTYIY